MATTADIEKLGADAIAREGGASPSKGATTAPADVETLRAAIREVAFSPFKRDGDRILVELSDGTWDAVVQYGTARAAPPGTPDPADPSDDELAEWERTAATRLDYPWWDRVPRLVRALRRERSRTP